MFSFYLKEKVEFGHLSKVSGQGLVQQSQQQ